MNKNSSLESRKRSLGIALGGLRQVLVAEPNARIHAIATLAAFVVGWLIKLTRQEWAILTLTVGLVWMAEAFNTAVELLVDLIQPEHHPAAKAVKDISAGAVLISALTALLVGLLLFGPPLWSWVVTLVNH